MARTSLKLTLVLPALILAAACDSTGYEPPVQGEDATFVVQMVNGARVPTVSDFEQPPLYVGCQLVQAGGVLTLFANGRYTMQVSTGAVVCPGGIPGSAAGYAMTGDYVRSGDQITFKPDFGLPQIVGAYDPTAGGSVSGTGYPGETPIPRITFKAGEYEYQLTQDTNELR